MIWKLYNHSKKLLLEYANMTPNPNDLPKSGLPDLNKDLKEWYFTGTIDGILSPEAQKELERLKHEKNYERAMGVL